MALQKYLRNLYIFLLIMISFGKDIKRFYYFEQTSFIFEVLHIVASLVFGAKGIFYENLLRIHTY